MQRHYRNYAEVFSVNENKKPRMEDQERKRKGDNTCCVVGCHNTYGNTSNLHFYSFPNREWEKERKEKWVEAIRRCQVDSTGKLVPWVPTKRSKICSAHFVNGEKKNHPHHPAFIPSIFPNGSVKTSSQKTDKILRIQRRERRAKVKSKNEKPKSKEVLQKNVVSQTQTKFKTARKRKVTTKADFECQHSTFLKLEDETTVCEIDRQGKTVAVQACIPRKIFIKRDVSPGSDLKKEAETQSDKGDIVTGYKSVKSEKQLLEIAGVSNGGFKLLSDMLQLIAPCKLSLENSLLLVLMKLKLGLSFTALSYLFHIDKYTCSHIFTQVLEILDSKTRDFIYWPSKAAVLGMLPEAFKKHFPNCRVILSCIELEIEEPPKSEDRYFLYSEKGTYALKFVIGITPDAAVSFVSKSYGGKANGGFIVEDSKLFDRLEPEDEVLTDKAFEIMYSGKMVKVVPPVIRIVQFTTEEIEKANTIASVRILIEKAIQRVKMYKVLEEKLPVELLPHAESILRLCCVLANLHPFDFKEMKEEVMPEVPEMMFEGKTDEVDPMEEDDDEDLEVQ